jgi:hydrogenase 3 maturation protease
MKRIAVCGIGNRLRGDDAVGPLMINELAKRDLPENVLLLDCGSTPEALSGKIIGLEPDLIILVDAVQMNRMPGEVEAIPIDKIKSMLATTHKMPITMFIEYLQRSLPKAEFVFIGIQHSSTVFGEELSRECRESIPKAASMIENLFNNDQK